jgi:indolepyruvate ferredoxin oxidoreductase beta subunit
MNNIESVLFVGVGGDGIITVSNVVAEAFMLAGLDVKKSEIHGMSQRGGSVSASVRFGKKVYSPTDKLGSVKYMIATEKIEALRWVKYLNKDSIVIVNNRIVPIINQTIDDENIDNLFKNIDTKILMIKKFIDDAVKLGNEKVVNTIMLGVLSKHLPVDEDIFFEAIDKIVPQKIKPINIEAFNFGRNLN